MDKCCDTRKYEDGVFCNHPKDFCRMSEEGYPNWEPKTEVALHNTYIP